MSYNNLRKGRYSQPYQEYFITTVISNRESIFHTFPIARMFIRQIHKLESTHHCQWLAWVVMPDHFHALLQLNGPEDLSSIMRTLKGRSSRVINSTLGRHTLLWQPGFYDHALRYDEDRKAISRYIIANPLRAGLVDNIGDYPHWDALWL